MSEITPTPGPEKEPPKTTPPAREPETNPPGKGAAAAMGVGLLVISLASAFFFPPVAILALIVAIGSLFFEGYRYIFVGYILTLLIGGGLAFLALIIICGNGNMGHM